MSERDPRIVAGVSALVAQRFVFVLALGLIATFVFLVWIALSQPFGQDLGPTFALALGPIFVDAVLFAVGNKFLAGRERAELAAGYTTLKDRYDHVDRLDHRNGTLMAPARIGSIAVEGVVEAITTGDGLDPVDVRHTPREIALRSPMTVALTLTGLILACVSIVLLAPFTFTDDGAAFGLGLVLTLDVLLLILGPLVPTGLIAQRRYLRAFNLQFPDASSWVTQCGSDIGDVVGELAAAAAPLRARARMSTYLVVERDRISFWSRSQRQFLPFLVVPRSRIARIETGTAMSDASRVLPAAVLSITKDNGSLAALSLLIGPNSGVISPATGELQMARAAEGLVRWRSTGDVNLGE